MKPIERAFIILILTILCLAAGLITVTLLAYVPYESPCSRICELCIDEAKEIPCE